MAKAPVCGAVKTRLARDIGLVPAVALTRALTAKLLRELAGDPRFRCVLAVSPATATMARFAAWGAGGGRVRRIAQARGDLGARMQAIFDRCGAGPLIIIGTDIPGITREIIADAFRQLRRADAVFGPAEDGGYWLVGLRRRPKIATPFANVRWSSPHALADTLANFQRIRFSSNRDKTRAPYLDALSSGQAISVSHENIRGGRRIAFSITLFDIDTGADYRRYRRL
ncbi:TIGR04282 family arsenosugar biosynthesis glycosyltransferase [Rhodomicrobium vannielii ATCC 17100]|uniref:TIGR04282 family arsenosugar biosynthesis glycosyltransferase n=1 Tax=Rhodomicrobium vannielii TaxID=1069 RepID=UPI00191A6E06|nr:TIGR04282 family arsenosugar biosynthesis glycosyltransferase [Rhodomicrobium vannielii]MBJ7534979.1 TIGR04282 family arsenosugar biosynthesis glycosyltransferase [Rhodomicrobium vannielii ATCC 17100]